MIALTSGTSDAIADADVAVACEGPTREIADGRIAGTGGGVERFETDGGIGMARDIANERIDTNGSVVVAGGVV